MSAYSGRCSPPRRTSTRTPHVRRRRRQPFDVGQTGRRRERCPTRSRRVRVSLTECDQRSPKARQGLSAGGFDGSQGLAGLLGLGLNDPAPHPGLDGDDADAVRDHVVQLPCDPQPFGDHGLSHLLRAQFHRVLAALAAQEADRAGRGHRQKGDHEVDCHALAVREAADEQDLDDEGRSHSDGRSPPRAGGDDEGQGEVHRQTGQELALVRSRQVHPGGARGAHDHGDGSEEHHGQGQNGPAP